ncbi:MAG: flagellar motor protein PomA [Gammaproteobacteria bacterium]|nr:flagellar motor protein PomA [Gammaproteobacteria bacterium]MDH5513716.1 flagellar motor protein PomA [Gammaproteobacteria bacterium]
MDLATLIGLIGTVAAILTAILMGGSIDIFVNAPGLMIVVAGTLTVVLMKYPLTVAAHAMKAAGKAFLNKAQTPKDLIAKCVELSNIARKEGVLGLEQVEIENEFLRRGVMLIVDGNDEQFVRKMLSNDINLTIERHEEGQGIFKSIGDVAPAMGMIGTLIGLVQMMANMSDPKALGPAMAVALLTTLYGAVIANVFALPIADKLALRSKHERITKSLILEGISSIQAGINPRVVEDLLKTYLPGNQRLTPKEDEAA